MNFDVVKHVRNENLIHECGKRIREWRIFRRLSQEKLANLAEIPIVQVGRIERGLTNPTISTMKALADALDVEINMIPDPPPTGSENLIS